MKGLREIVDKTHPLLKAIQDIIDSTPPMLTVVASHPVLNALYFWHKWFDKDKKGN